MCVYVCVCVKTYSYVDLWGTQLNTRVIVPTYIITIFIKSSVKNNERSNILQGNRSIQRTYIHN